MKKPAVKRPAVKKPAAGRVETAPAAPIVFDRPARETMAAFAAQPVENVTAGSIQASFHKKEREENKSEYSGDFPLVAIGASAGGVESFTELLRNLPADTGMAYVFIQHLAPHHESLLPAILSRVTPMEVIRAETNMSVKINCVYVIPPNCNMGIINGLLKLLPRLEQPVRHMPIDFFFRCMAEDQAHLGIGVILSGADGDGAQGLRAIRAHGGVTLVQDPTTAKVDSMPRNAIAAGGTDTILTIPEIAQELTRLGGHPWVRADVQTKAADTDLSKIFTLLKSYTGVNFAHYKKGTILRRLRRRLLLHQVVELGEYYKLLNRDREEVDLLYRDLLINVTSFFRDAEAFDRLKADVLHRLLQHPALEMPLRIWIPGCSTGEEVYSIAISLLEMLDADSKSCAVQIFASDVSEQALEKARDGFYNESIAVDLTPDRLRRFFTKVSSGYRVASHVRELCIFARHDVMRDPPFSRMDLISCRNLLIYLEPEHQMRVINLFAYALKPMAFLMLGNAETIGPSESFEVFDKEARIYQRKAVISRAHFDVPLAPAEVRLGPIRSSAKLGETTMELEREVTRILLERYSPVGVLVSESMQILQFRGATGKYLEPAPGEASLNLFKMAKAGLDTELRILLKKAEKSGKPVRKDHVARRAKGAPANSGTSLALEAIPISIDPERRFYLVLFDEREAVPAAARQAPGAAHDDDARESDMTILRDELVSTRDHLQAIIRDQDSTNQALQAANEEVLSSNEELQSTNEELETAKEELQSTNEELTTVNDELSNRNSALLRSNNDFSNLLASVSLPIVMVGNDLRIRRFTPTAERVLNLIASDVGRPITDIKPNVEVPDLEKLIHETIESTRTIDRDVADRSGHMYSLRIRPYRTSENKVDGAVLLLVDISAAKATKVDPGSHDFDESLFDTIEQPILFLDAQFKVKKLNRSYARVFQKKVEDVGGKNFFELSDGAWTVPMLKALLSDVIPKNHQIVDYQIEKTFPLIGKKSFLLNARRIFREGVFDTMVILDDVTKAEPAPARN